MKKEIISKFTNETDFEKLEGGQNESFKVGDYVFKPVSEPEKYKWIGHVFEDVSPDSILISKPIKSKIGKYIEDGFGVTIFIPGAFYPLKMKEKLEAAQKFHRSVASIEKPNDFYKWTSPWTQATQGAWKEIEIPESFHKQARLIIQSLLEQMVEINLNPQLIHSDLSGNILFNSTKPIIIDISPDFRPVEYAQTILVTDSIAWFDEPLKSLDLLQFDPDLKNQLVLRAIVFRLCTPLFFNHDDIYGFMNELKDFKPILDYMDIQY